MRRVLRGLRARGSGEAVVGVNLAHQAAGLHVGGAGDEGDRLRRDQAPRPSARRAQVDARARRRRARRRARRRQHAGRGPPLLPHLSLRRWRCRTQQRHANLLSRAIPTRQTVRADLSRERPWRVRPRLPDGYECDDERCRARRGHRRGWGYPRRPRGGPTGWRGDRQSHAGAQQQRQRCACHDFHSLVCRCSWLHR